MLKRFLFLTLLVHGLAFSLRAQSVVLSRADSVYTFFEQASALEVPPGRVTIDSLLQHPERYRFVPIRQKPIQPRRDRGYWFRVDFTNPRPDAAFIRLQFLNVTKLVFYEVAGGKVINQYQQRHALDASTDPYLFGKRLWPLRLGSGQTHTVYIFAQGMGSPNLHLVAEPSLALMKSNLRQDLLFGLFYGFTIIILLYSLLMFFRLGDRSNLYYALSLIVSFPYTTHGYGHTATWLGTYYDWSVQYFAFGSALSAITHLLFSMEVLQIRQYSRFVYRLGFILLIGFSIRLAFVLAYKLLGYSIDLYGLSIQVLLLLLALYSLIAGITAYRKGYAPSLYYLLGQVSLFVAVYLGQAAIFGRLPMTFWTAHAILIGGAVQMLFFTLSLANKINLLKKSQKQASLERLRLMEENRQLVESQKQVLEQKVEERTAELKASQAQLIQREKMASLGELTAGIAHEIQNPLNFVNNFSEVSRELVEEIKEERQKTTEARDEELVGELLEDLEQNLSKIYHHGRRAEFIVKGMLAHSRTSSGEKRPTDLNAMAEEYLRLSYHGIQAKDKTFTAQLVTEFRELPRLTVAPQDLGRVLVNLYNNAFYALQEKQKQSPADYQPQVWVGTEIVDGQVQLRVRDNGTRIPPEILNKIYQPFFTTKPTGQGTGLGLSLSYDIVTKGHGGELKVETQAGQGAEFIIRIPITTP